MKRRESIKKLILVSGTVITLPAWATNLFHTSIHRSSFTITDQETLAAVADAIIPPGNSIGAISVGVDKFLQKLIDDCFEKDVQDNIKTQLAGLDGVAQDRFAKPYAQCELSQRQELLIARSSDTDKAGKDFFDIMKSETIRGFSTSREVMLDYHHFKLVPGHYLGCVDIKS